MSSARGTGQLALVPAHNEAQSIAGILDGLKWAAPTLPVLVVASACSDETASIAAKLGATVAVEREPGYSRALLCGYRYALEEGYSEVVQLDADGQHPPAAAPRLLGALGTADWIIGSRHNTGSRGPLPRRAGSAFLGTLLRYGVASPLYDPTSGYWAMGRPCLEFLARSFPLACVDANIRLKALRSGLRIREVPVAMDDRQSGTSMHSGLTGVLNFCRSSLALARLLADQSQGRLTSAAEMSASSSM
jgi:glycosyltransferase involved in cell wall biosynthesis